MGNISPGVYTKITDLSTFVQQVPGTIGFISALTRKGEDNVLKFIGDRSELVGEYGEPDITDFGKYFGQGMYCAYNFLGESGALFFTRCMPDDATYSNLRIDLDYGPSDDESSVVVSYVGDGSTESTQNGLQSKLVQETNIYPICVLRPIGRGEYYNGISIAITEHSNPLVNGVYVLDIYERQSNNSDIIIESFEVSFNPNAKDSTGESVWIQHVLNTYSSILRVDMTNTLDAMSSGYETGVRVYDKEIGDTTVVKIDTNAEVTDIKQDFNDWDSDYVIIIKDGKGNKLWGFLGNSNTDGDNCTVFSERSKTTQSWNGTIDAKADFDISDPDMTYEIRKSHFDISVGAFASDPVVLKKGSDGSLRTGTGDIDPAVADTLLANGYAGSLKSTVDGTTLVDDALDDENIYFNLVFDCGYNDDVKTAISTLVQTRRDCIGILDNGDNVSTNAALTARKDNHVFNNYLLALYEPYNKVKDNFTGQDVWFSPIYHMSYILPRNDRVAEIWRAPAGFNRGTIDTIKELRYNPRLGQRDQFYLKQINPIVKFAPGYAIWGQLTTQAKASALQDINVVRLVLYCDRAINQYAKFFIFEDNTSMTWSQVAGDVIDFLENVKKKRGLYGYSVEVSATPYERKAKTFHINVVLEPVRTVEKIELNFFIK